MFSSRNSPAALGFLFFYPEPFPEECTSLTKKENMKKPRFEKELKESREDLLLRGTSMRPPSEGAESQAWSRRSAIPAARTPAAPEPPMLHVALEHRVALIVLSDLLSLNVASTDVPSP